MSAGKVFDYVVVGGGQAGLVVASRLSEDPEKSVLVIEAGTNISDDEKVATPGLLTALYGDEKYDWNFLSAPQAHLENRVFACPRGKGLGGTSSINFGAVLYGTRSDFDSWTALGNQGWRFDDMVEYYRKSETFCAPVDDVDAQDLYQDNIDVDIHGKDGPVRIGFNADYSNFNEAWSQTFQKLGHYSSGDTLSGKKLGTFRGPLTIDPETSKRVSSATAYYGAAVAARPNLTVWTECFAEKIVLEKVAEDDVVAKGVELTTASGERIFVAASSEVILAAGTVKSPQLLELSGIGGRDLLTKQGIQVVIDNPGVGENLQDYPLACMSFEVGDGMWSGDLFNNPHFFQAVEELYKSTGTGPLAGVPLSYNLSQLVDVNGKLSNAEIKTLVDTHLHGATYPSFPAQKLQYELLVKKIQDTTEPAAEFKFLPLQLNFSSSKMADMATFFSKLQPENYVSIVASITQTFSRGTVHISSQDPHAQPIYDPRYLSHPMDLEMLARIVQYVKVVASTEPFAAQLKPNGHQLPEGSVKDLDAAKIVTKERLFSGFSPIGTCAMMKRDIGGVVDDKLVVYGTRNLRVVDASVFPLQTVGTIQATVYAVAEKAADLIKSAHQK